MLLPNLVLSFIYPLRFLVTECQVGEFTCDNGQCILEAELCNQVTDCQDGSDELLEYCSYRRHDSNSGTTSIFIIQ